MRIVLCVPAISAGMIGAALAIGVSPVVAADCLAEPNRDAPPGQHWYYHLDHANDRKCWYLHATVPGVPRRRRRWNCNRCVRSGGRWPPPEPQRRQAAPARCELQRRQVAAPQRPAQRSEAEEAALYLEFLRWKEQHRDAQ